MKFPNPLRTLQGWLAHWVRDFDDGAGFTPSFGLGALSSSGVRITQETAMACDAVMACVSLIAEDIAKLPPRLIRRLPTGQRQIATDQAFYPLLRTPNDWQTWQEFTTMMMVGLLLRGNGYAAIVRDGRGNPVYLVPINPDQVGLWIAPDGALFYRVNRGNLHEMAVLAHEPLLIPARDVFHLKGLSSNGLLGLSKIALNRESIGLAIAQEQQAGRWMSQGARPSGALMTDKNLTPETARILRENWEAQQVGILNHGRPAVLEGGLKWQPLGLTGDDLEFIASRTFQLNSVARLWRVPPHMIGELTKATNNSLTQLSQEYVNFTLSTYTTLWAQRVAKTFDLDDDVTLDFDMSVLLRGDITARYQNYRIGAQGWLTINEIRDAEGLDPVADGDVIYRPVNMAPLGSSIFEANDLNENPSGVGSDQGGENPDGGRPSNDTGPTAGQNPRAQGGAQRPFDRSWNPNQPRDANGRWAGMPGARRIRKFLTKCLKNKGQHFNLDCGSVPDWNIHDIGHHTGFDLTGYKRVMPSGDLVHAMKEHGDQAREQLRKIPQTAISRNDFGRVGKIIANAHSITSKGKIGGNKAPTIHYTANVGRYEYHYIELLQTKHKNAAFKSLWKVKMK